MARKTSRPGLGRPLQDSHNGLLAAVNDEQLEAIIDEVDLLVDKLHRLGLHESAEHQRSVMSGLLALRLTRRTSANNQA
jgi:hypothetical protein